MRIALIAAALAFLTGGRALAAPEIRVCPPEQLWAHSEEEQRRVRSLLLQNLAVANPDGPAFQLQEIEIALLNGDTVRDVRRLGAPELAAQGSASAGVAAMADLLPGQFCSGTLFGGLKLSTSAEVAPGSALVVNQQTFAWNGQRDRLRITARGQLAGRPVEVTRTLPIRSGASQTAFRFPLRGVWYVGSAGSAHTHHRWGVFEEFAIDLVQLGEGGLTYRGDGTRFTDYFAYGQPVLAAAGGTVVGVLDGVAEDLSAMKRPGETSSAYLQRLMVDQQARVRRGAAGVIGNHVVIDHGNGEASLYAHLKPGSIRVRKGQRVEPAQVLAEIGSSGNSTEPHLHFQVCDGPDPMACHSIPPQFVGLEIPMDFATRPLQSGDVVRDP